MTSETYTTYRPIPESVLRQKYCKDRLSMRSLADEFACSTSRIRKKLLKHKIPLRSRSQRDKSKWLTYGKRMVGGKVVDHRDELKVIATIKQMYREGAGTAAIARFLNNRDIPAKKQGSRGWHQNTVATILKREGICLRSRSARPPIIE